MKITARDYVEARDDLSRAGFMSIKKLLSDDEDGVQSPTNIAILYGIDVKNVELVKTTSAYSEYTTIVSLEIEKEELQEKLELDRASNEKPAPTTWHYIGAFIILVGLLIALGWGIFWLVKLIGGLL